MRYIWQHIQTILENYTGGVPLSHFLKNYFKQHPKLGSRDRKILSDMAYSWYRCSKALKEDLPLQQKMQACLYLCDTNTPQTRQFIPADWPAKESSDVGDRMAFLSGMGYDVEVNKLVPFNPITSKGIAGEEWLASMLRQPRLFIRIRKGKSEVVKLLRQHELEYVEMNSTCISLPNGAAVDKILPPDLYMVQDYSSQQTGCYFKPIKGETWWDCCSGAGGKSLLLKDMEPGVQLTVSDKRQSILLNLKERFRLYKHTAPVAITADATIQEELGLTFGGKQFDNIICDVPCTGSGTWARTPEQLYFFKEKYLKEYSDRQKQIAVNVVSYLKPGGRLLYITCSIFKEENEEVVDHILAHHDLVVEEKGLINGIEHRADSMFVTVLRK